jgi:hypothetical protein
MSFLETAAARGTIGHGHEKEPLLDYALLMTTFTMLCAVGFGRALIEGRAPRRVPLSDVVLLGLACARMSRLLTREKVTRPIRAPFTEVAPDARPDEVKELPRQGRRHAMGELLTCPRCAGMWTSAALTIAYSLAPLPTREVAALLSVAMISDLTNARFAAARRSASAHAAPATPEAEPAPRPRHVIEGHVV